MSEVAEKPKLGRGLESLIPKSFLAKGKTITTLPISEIRPNPFQPRLTFREDELKSLSESIKQYGLNQPILVRRVGERYELIAGERRYRASILAGLSTISAIVREVSDRESLLLALVENLERENLNAIEEGQGYMRLMDEFGMTHQQLADSFGKSRSAVTNTLRLLKLPMEVQDGLSRGKISTGHARSLLSLSTHDAIIAEYRRLTSGEEGEKDNVRELEARVSKLKAEPKKTRQKPKAIQQIEALLAECYDNPVEIKGTSKRGKIILSYKNADQFERLVKSLNLQPE